MQKNIWRIIDRKSIRLKNLTEDLVEASKLNAGATNFEMQQIDIVQLVNQSLGEYEEKFEEKTSYCNENNTGRTRYM